MFFVKPVTRWSSSLEGHTDAVMERKGQGILGIMEGNGKFGYFMRVLYEFVMCFFIKCFFKHLIIKIMLT